MLEFTASAVAILYTPQAWFLAQPIPMQIVVGVVALAVFWVLRIVLRVTLAAFRASDSTSKNPR